MDRRRVNKKGSTPVAIILLAACIVFVLVSASLVIVLRTKNMQDKIVSGATESTIAKAEIVQYYLNKCFTKEEAVKEASKNYKEISIAPDGSIEIDDIYLDSNGKARFSMAYKFGANIIPSCPVNKA